MELSRGKTVPEAAKNIGVTEQAYYRWKKKYGGLRVDQAKRLKDLEKENARHKQLLTSQVAESSRTIPLQVAPQPAIRPHGSAIVSCPSAAIPRSPPDRQLRTPEGYDAILADIGRELRASRPVYVHRWGGVGRTGTVAGLVYVSRGADADTALEAIREARRGTRKAHRPAPEMPCQVEVIRRIAERKRPGRS